MRNGFSLATGEFRIVIPIHNLPQIVPSLRNGGPKKNEMATSATSF